MLLLGGLLAAGGCAANNARQDASRMDGPGKDLLKAWQQAARQPLEAADSAPEPEPQLLPATHYSAGTVFEKQRNYGQAVEQYRKAIELDGRFAAAHARLGLCYLRVGQPGQAVESLRRAADLLPDNAQVQNNLGFACLAQGDSVRAEKCFRRALAIQPTLERARMNLALALVRQQRDGDALGELKVAAPEHLALHNLGTMQLAQGRAASARQSFEKALQIRPEFPAARKALDQAIARLPQPAPIEPAVAQVSEPPAATAVEQAAPQVVVEPAGFADLARVAEPVESATLCAEAALASRPVAGADDDIMIASAAASHEDAAAADLSVRVEEAEPACWASLELLSDSWLADAVPAVDESTICLNRPDESHYRAVADAITASMLPVPVVSVVEMDLPSLQWAAWARAIEAVYVDLEMLPVEELPAVMGKWLTALNELEGLVADPLPTYAWAK